MPFSLDHWRNPRNTIANEFKNNDLGYYNHGMKVAAEIIRALDLKPSHMKTMQVLDYGCGTGRISIAMSHIFHRVIGYDPVKECIDVAYTDRQRCMGKTVSMTNVSFHSDFSELSHMRVDAVVAVSVLEHLSLSDQIVALRNIVTVMSNDAKALLWLHTIKNAQICKFLNIINQPTGHVIVSTLDRSTILQCLDNLPSL